MTPQPHDMNEDNSAEDDPSLEGFARQLRRDLPRLPDAAMQRIERCMQAELDEVFPRAPIPISAWPRWVAVAAMLLLVIGLAWHVSTDRNVPSRPQVASRVSDEFQIVIESETAAGDHTVWDALFPPLDRYAGLLGLERLTRR